MVEARALAELRGVDKSFLHSRALAGLSLDFLEGETLGIVGHNGAGKSTLVNLLVGVLRPTAGTIRMDGDPLEPGYDVHAARRRGVRAVFQELSLCPNLTVIENLRVFHPSLRGPGWPVRAQRLIMGSLDAIFPGHGIRPRDIVGSLPLGQRQMVEIAKAFTSITDAPRLVILDEPTSALDGHASAQLIAHLNRLRGGKQCIVFISHLLDEVLSCTDRIAVLKDGSCVAILETRTASRSSVIESMGEARLIKDDAQRRPGTERSHSESPFVVEPAVDDGTLRVRVRAGEIVGLAGLAGHGQTELLRRLFDYRGTRDYRVRGPTTFVPGDRQADGVFPVWSVTRNLTVQVYGRVRRLLLIDPRREAALAQRWKDAIGIRTDSVSRWILSLSGGNQQKVLFARSLASDSPLVLMDDPTRGVDVGTKDEIYRLILEESRKGRSFVWYTTEMGELAYCDRIYVFKSGRIIAELAGDQATEEDILKSSF